MHFPQTPENLMSRLRGHTMPAQWERNWDEFFSLYYRAIRTCVVGSFRRANWHQLDEAVVEDVVMQVFEAILRGQVKLDYSKGRFRQLVATVCHRRVVDYIRRHNHTASHLHAEQEKLQALSNEAAAVHDEEEVRQFRQALLATLLDALRREVSPQVFLIFELIKINGEPPETVASELGVKRGVVDNSVYKAMKQLKVIATRPEFREEYES